MQTIILRSDSLAEQIFLAICTGRADKNRVTAQHVFNLASGTPATVRTLSGTTLPGVPFEARMERADNRVLSLLTGVALGPGEPVRVDIDGGMVLAEVSWAEPIGSGYHLHLAISQVIPSLSEVSVLMNGIWGANEGFRAAPEACSGAAETQTTGRFAEIELAVRRRITSVHGGGLRSTA